MAFPSLGDMVLNAGLLLTMVLFTLKVTSITGNMNVQGHTCFILLWATVLLFGAWTTQLIIGLGWTIAVWTSTCSISRGSVC
ncbi:MAG: hypothetical protein IPN38_15130 [Flavobacteriales bacterium]|nr:hypothetical protein [Flavobacteriales bacterium]